MSIKEYSREELEVKSMLELAHEILLDERRALDFNELYDKTADLKGFTEEKKHEFIAQFYTDLTVDGRFLNASAGIWGLKRWYPVEQIDEEVAATPKKKSKKKKQKKEEKQEKQEKQEKEETPKNQDVTEEDLAIDDDFLDDDVDDLDLDESDDMDEAFDQEFDSEKAESDDEEK
ncbi:DNA-directed RNA polymerase subunit delta [Lentibacillus cibarius]|uniref:Probable DNA-directed RNA polymerase subunit delta n=1 Tax=Lentibacillus cibarius TaxID=2583219 RepID=A0A5S3QJB1_9BACI|nr:DNA-directed RNA polymerase subunit delta [Lentibacillus cibarius]TMN22022.1 DNA-directed RNA polymerase subunit delta [Lentibacillus cibarius]